MPNIQHDKLNKLLKTLIRSSASTRGSEGTGTQAKGEGRTTLLKEEMGTAEEMIITEVAMMIDEEGTTMTEKEEMGEVAKAGTIETIEGGETSL